MTAPAAEPSAAEVALRRMVETCEPRGLGEPWTSLVRTLLTEIEERRAAAREGAE